MRALVAVALFLAGFALSQAQTVCIDPGHPSEVGRGTRGAQTTEIDVAWQVANSLATTLRQKGLRVVLTKSQVNQFVKNRARAEMANQAKADLMVRLHCDASNGSGFAVYYPSQQGRSNGVRGPSAEVIASSKEAARRFHAALAMALGDDLKDNGLKTDLETAVGAKQGALTGSIFSKVPVLLVEMVVLTNPKDEQFISSLAGRKAMVNALVQGVFASLKLDR